MIVFARGSITNPDALAPYIEDEMRVVDQLKAGGVMTAAYLRGDLRDLDPTPPSPKRGHPQRPCSD